MNMNNIYYDKASSYLLYNTTFYPYAHELLFSWVSPWLFGNFNGAHTHKIIICELNIFRQVYAF